MTIIKSFYHVPILHPHYTDDDDATSTMTFTTSNDAERV